MSKNCYSCGSAIGENQAFCAQCGAKLNIEQNEQIISDEQIKQGKPKKKRKKLIIVLSIITLFVLIVGGITATFVSVKVLNLGYQIPLQNMIGGLEKKDYDKFLGAFLPSDQKILEEKRQNSNLTKEEFMKAITYKLNYKLGKNYKLDYVIADSFKLGNESLMLTENNYAERFWAARSCIINIRSVEKRFYKKISTVQIVNLKGKWYITLYPNHSFKDFCLNEVYEKPVIDFFNGILKCDFDVFIGALAPQNQIKAENERNIKGLSKEEIMKFYFDINSLIEKYGKDFTLDYELNSSVQLNKDEIDDLKRDRSLRDTVKDAYKLSIQVYADNEITELLNVTEIFAIKIEDKWYALV